MKTPGIGYAPTKGAYSSIFNSWNDRRFHSYPMDLSAHPFAGGHLDLDAWFRRYGPAHKTENGVTTGYFGVDAEALTGLGSVDLERRFAAGEFGSADVYTGSPTFEELYDYAATHPSWSPKGWDVPPTLSPVVPPVQPPVEPPAPPPVPPVPPPPVVPPPPAEPPPPPPPPVPPAPPPVPGPFERYPELMLLNFEDLFEPMKAGWYLKAVPAEQAEPYLQWLVTKADDGEHKQQLRLAQLQALGHMRDHSLGA